MHQSPASAFALLKALKEDDQEHQILFFSDYQNTSLAAWDLSKLPANIAVYEGNRRQFRHLLTQSWQGKLFYFLAMQKLKAPVFLHKPLFDTLDQTLSEFGKNFAKAENRRLWLFNERNKMARVFRLVSQNFSLIEEGSGNYHYWHYPWWRWPARALIGVPYNKCYMGEDNRCTEIEVSHPDKMPPFVRHKGRKIDYLNTPESKAIIRRVFVKHIELEKLPENIILATSPLENLDGIETDGKIAIYERVIATLAELGYAVLVKLHPRESREEYAPIADGVAFAPEKLPLEVLIVLSPQPVTVVSFFTSSGIGLEQYFTLIELCDRKADNSYDLDKVVEWMRQPAAIENAVKTKVQPR
jgi:hypothetical protein